MPTLRQTRVTERVKSKGEKADIIHSPSKDAVNSFYKQQLQQAQARLKTETDPKVIAKLHDIIANLKGSEGK